MLLLFVDSIVLLRFLLGSAVILLGVALFIWPKPVFWLSDQTNLRAARERAARGHTYGMDNYHRTLKTLRWVMPAFTVLMGIVIYAGAFF